MLASIRIAAACAALTLTLGVLAIRPLPLAAATTTPACPVHVAVETLGSDHPDEALLTLWSEGTATKASGSIVIFAADRRFNATFADALAADVRNASVLPSVIVVQLPVPAPVQSAYVGALDAQTCAVHQPYVDAKLEQFDHHYSSARGTYPDWSANWKQLRAQALQATPLRLSAGEPADAPACARPYVMADTLRVTLVPELDTDFRGPVIVNLALNADGTVAGTRVDRSSHDSRVDRVASETAKTAKFSPQLYRCVPVSGDYLFEVDFG